MNSTVKVAGLAIGIIIFSVLFWVLLDMKEVEMFPGDKKEVRQCRDCGGDGDDGGGSCPSCGSSGELEAIIPGPNRGPWIYGGVYDLEKIRGAFVRPRSMYAAIPGAVKDAKVTITYQGSPKKRVFRKPMSKWPLLPIPNGYNVEKKTYKFTTTETGRFTLRLPPGYWKVEVLAPAFAPKEKYLNVPFLTRPVWLEVAHIERSPDDPMYNSETSRQFFIPVVPPK